MLAMKHNGLSFTPAVEPPDEMPADALCFLFRRYDLLVWETEPEMTVPALAELAQVGPRVARWHFLGYWTAAGQTRACYAGDAGEDALAPAGGAFLGLRTLFGRAQEGLFDVAGRAVQIVDWDRTHQYCSRCGTPTQDQVHERARICPECGLTNYPRLSPAIIVRVQRTGADGRSRILLARNRRYPGGMFSVLAGFVEPGETLEECVAREIWEEVGITVHDISYIGSQPWPFPHSLMIAFTAEHAAGEIAVDIVELEEARWFAVDELPKTPPPPSIANQLIQTWAAANAI